MADFCVVVGGRGGDLHLAGVDYDNNPMVIN